MKMYNSVGPNPRLVRMFLAEKGLEIPAEEVDIMAGENRGPEYTAKNPGAQLPAIELDDGSVLAETTVICNYLEEIHPEKPLIGSTPEERANTRMWTRRIEQKITGPQTDAFRYGAGLSMFKDRMRTIPEAAEDLKALARDGWEWLEPLLEGREWIAGDRFSLADIVLYCLADFFGGVGQPVPTDLPNVKAWYDRVNARPSAEASLHPAAKAGGMRA